MGLLYRAIVDEQLNLPVIDEIRLHEKGVTVIRELPKLRDTEHIFTSNYEEAKEELKELKEDPAYFDEETTIKVAKEYIVRNNLKGFCYIKPLNVWTHSMYLTENVFEYGDLSYIVSEVSMKKLGTCLTGCYPCKCDNNYFMAHSFTELLEFAARYSDFELVGTKKYSESDMRAINFVRAENGFASI